MDGALAGDSPSRRLRLASIALRRAAWRARVTERGDLVVDVRLDVRAARHLEAAVAGRLRLLACPGEFGLALRDPGSVGRSICRLSPGVDRAQASVLLAYRLRDAGVTLRACPSRNRPAGDEHHRECDYLRELSRHGVSLRYRRGPALSGRFPVYRSVLGTGRFSGLSQYSVTIDGTVVPHRRTRCSR